MSTDQPPAAGTTFEIVHDATPSGTLVTGFSEFGLAGVTAADYLVDRLELEETGHITVDGLPAITPFENGTPRHHTRLFSKPDLDLTVLVGELFVPPAVADTFAGAVLEWTEANDVEEITVLSGVPIPHGPDAHRAFYVATEDYRRRRLQDALEDTGDERTDGDADDGAIRAMGNGYLSGINGSLMARGLDSSLAVCVLTTPVHSQGPDVDAALRVLEAVERVYGLDVDTGPLEQFAQRLSQYYERLAEHVETAEEDRSGRYEDRMYM